MPALRFDKAARIARDEQRHAELAFRFVSWALARDPACVRERIEAVSSRSSQRDILEAVTLPCLAALLAHQKQPEGLEGMSRAAFLS
jgi:hypothetical protein